MGTLDTVAYRGDLLAVLLTKYNSNEQIESEGMGGKSGICGGTCACIQVFDGQI